MDRSRVLELVLKGKDQLSGTVKNAANNMQASLKGVTQSTGLAATSTGQLAGAVAIGQAAYEGLGAVIASTTQFLKDSVAAANKYQAAILGLTSVSTAFGSNAIQAKQAAEMLASDGLMSVTESAVGLKNLLATGFSLDQATVLMSRFKDSAAFGRQAALGFGEAIAGATEGLKNGNSILVDNAGVTKNLSVILKEMGKSEQDVMNISSDASVRQAVFNGLLKETSANVGDAAKMTGTFAGAQAAAQAQLTQLQIGIGSVAQTVAGPLVSGFTDFIKQNQNAIISFGGAAVAAGAFVGAIFLVAGAVNVLKFALIALTTNPVVLFLTALAGIVGYVAYGAFERLQGKVAEQNAKLTDNGNAANHATQQTKQLTQAQIDLAKKIADINLQIERANRSFREQLAQMVKSHQEKAKSLSQQLADENKSFEQSAADDREAFDESQAEQVKTHEEKVAKIEAQIKQQLALGQRANASRLADLRQQLAKENTEYEADQAKAKARYDEDRAREQEAHIRRVNDLQVQLDAENALLTKHAADVASIRDADFIDEIDALRRSRNEQIESLEKQKNDAITKTGEQNAGIVAENAKLPGLLQGALQGPMGNVGKSIGDAMGQAMLDSFNAFIGGLTKGVVDFVADSILGLSTDANIKANINSIKLSLSTAQRQLREGKISKERYDQIAQGALAGLPKRAHGGPVSANQPYIVGERGPELFMPNNSGQIMPNGQMGKNAGINIEKVVMNNQVDAAVWARQLAWELRTR